jgi:hypothetical protein
LFRLYSGKSPQAEAGLLYIGNKMKKTSFGLATAILLGFASFSAPASAFNAPLPAAGTISDVTAVQYRRHAKVCTVRTVVTRGLLGRRVVKKVRVCR